MESKKVKEIRAKVNKTQKELAHLLWGQAFVIVIILTFLVTYLQCLIMTQINYELSIMNFQLIVKPDPSVVPAIRIYGRR